MNCKTVDCKRHHRHVRSSPNNRDSQVIVVGEGDRAYVWVGRHPKADARQGFDARIISGRSRLRALAKAILEATEGER